MAFFISFRSGLASLVSVGSCRIFKRMLYRDGALISSCSRMRPADKGDACSVKEEFQRSSDVACLISLALGGLLGFDRTRKHAAFRFSHQKKAHLHAFLISSTEPPTHKQTGCSRPRIKYKITHTHSLLPPTEPPPIPPKQPNVDSGIGSFSF